MDGEEAALMVAWSVDELETCSELPRVGGMAEMKAALMDLM